MSASLFHLSLKNSNIRAIFISLKQFVDIRIRGCQNITSASADVKNLTSVASLPTTTKQETAITSERLFLVQTASNTTTSINLYKRGMKYLMNVRILLLRKFLNVGYPIIFCLSIKIDYILIHLPKGSFCP